MEDHHAESLNNLPTFIRARAVIAAVRLCDIARGQIVPTSIEMGESYAGCTNAGCGRQKKWFARGGEAALG